MSRSRHTEAQIITALKQVEAGRTVGDVVREQGVSKHTIYAWKAKYGGMEVSEAEVVTHLCDEPTESTWEETSRVLKRRIKLSWWIYQ